jgi:S-(hydroxymethyl)glutathione dehydrogenase/alcohol dehydrogenase
MAAAGVCHSDLHVVDGAWERPAGVVMGHEGAAWIEELGEGLTGLEVGDLVVLAWTAPCRSCERCRHDEPWLCERPDGSGHRLAPELARLHDGAGRPVGAYSGIGTFGERQVVAASAAIKVDPRTPPEIAALIGCAVTTGVGAVRNTARVEARESVTVIGLGGVGLSAVIAAVAQDAHPVTAIDRSPAKLDLAMRAGARQALLPDEAAQSRKADHVLECIGLVETAELAVDLARPGGTITLVGMTPQGHRASFDVYRLVEDGKTIRGSNYGSADPARDFPAIADDYLQGRLGLDVLITERIGLHQLADAFEAMRRGEGARRVIVY